MAFIKLSALLAISILLFAIGCRSAPVVVPTPVVVVAPPSFDPEAENKELAKVTIYGFKRFSQGMSHSKFDEYGDQSAKVVRDVISRMPDEYSIQIVGHALDYASMRKEYIRTLSSMRAKYVFNYFIRKDLPEARMSYIGVGSEDTDGDTNGSGGSVSFRVIKKKP